MEMRTRKRTAVDRGSDFSWSLQIGENVRDVGDVVEMLRTLLQRLCASQVRCVENEVKR